MSNIATSAPFRPTGQPRQNRAKAGKKPLTLQRRRYLFTRISKAKEAVLHDSKPDLWACECGQMNLREDYYCPICGGDRAENWERNDHEAALRDEQWDTDLRMTQTRTEENSEKTARFPGAKTEGSNQLPAQNPNSIL